MEKAKKPVNMRVSECGRTCVRKKDILKKGIVAVLLGTLALSSLSEISVKAAETNWSYDYTGDVQSFEAPYTGEYNFTMYGAQGGNYGSFVGGKGGEVEVSLALNKGDVVEIYVGGQNGYNGGGSGNVSFGGGATDIRINGQRIAIAGGGGGATAKKNGGDAGIDNAGNNGTSFIGASSTSAGTAGGGAGYNGGIVGQYYKKTGPVTYTVYWNRTGGTSTGQDNYWISDTDNGSYNYARSSYKIIKTEPASSISATVQGENTWNWTGSRYNTPYDFVFSSSYGNYRVNMGQNDITPVNFTTAYSVANATITTNTASFGGSSWFDDSICTESSSMAGVREGNGMVAISIDGFSNLYYSNVNVTDVNYGGLVVKQIYYSEELIYFMP